MKVKSKHFTFVYYCCYLFLLAAVKANHLNICDLPNLVDQTIHETEKIFKNCLFNQRGMNGCTTKIDDYYFVFKVGSKIFKNDTFTIHCDQNGQSVPRDALYLFKHTAVCDAPEENGFDFDNHKIGEKIYDQSVATVTKSNHLFKKYNSKHFRYVCNVGVKSEDMELKEIEFCDIPPVKWKDGDVEYTNPVELFDQKCMSGKKIQNRCTMYSPKGTKFVSNVFFGQNMVSLFLEIDCNNYISDPDLRISNNECEPPKIINDLTGNVETYNENNKQIMKTKNFTFQINMRQEYKFLDGTELKDFIEVICGMDDKPVPSFIYVVKANDFDCPFPKNLEDLPELSKHFDSDCIDAEEKTINKTCQYTYPFGMSFVFNGNIKNKIKFKCYFDGSSKKVSVYPPNLYQYIYSKDYLESLVISHDTIRNITEAKVNEETSDIGAIFFISMLLEIMFFLVIVIWRYCCK